MSSCVPPEPGSEPDRIEAWRLETLLEAGYSLRMAERLAEDRDVDLHKAVKLLEAGCPLRLARQILT